MKRTFLLGLTLCLPLTAIPQTTITGETTQEGQVYVPADFERFAPRTALDLLVQIPGFSIRGGSGQRGFGQAQENVLINGKRITAKTTSATDVLQQLSADNVVRIVIVEGADLDIPGLSGQVANVITKAEGLSGTWNYRQRYRENLRPIFDWFDISVNGTAGDLKWRASLNSDPGRGANAGRENITNGDGELLQFREEDFTFHGDRVVGEVGLVWDPDDSREASLNASYGIREVDEQEFSNRFLPDGTAESEAIFSFAEDEWESEVSGDFAFDLGPGRLKLIGLQRNEDSAFTENFKFGASDGSVSSDTIFLQSIFENESILRGEYNLQGQNNSDWQISLEGVYNLLESDEELLAGDLQTDPVLVAESVDGIEVEELRFEAFVSHGRQLRPNVRLQASLGAEYSEVSSDGQNAQTRSFTRPKGSLALSWEARDNLTINTELSREIGQLSLFDFVPDVDLDDGDNRSGNIDIEPDKTTRLEVQLERDYAKWGNATLTLYGEQIDDIIDRVPIMITDANGNTSIREARGNVDSATRYGFDLAGTFLFDALGWKGAQLDYEFEYRRSEIDDPLTGETRRISGDKIRFIDLEFRQDISGTDWAYGWEVENYYESPVFRLNVVNSFESVPPFASVFIEHKDIFGLTANATLGNVFDQDDNFTRLRFSPDRNGNLTQVEDRSRNFGPILTLRLSGSF
ncbi:MAG: TonB-dependent receptor plug domain-containing protein [Pseudomonadota bacterium]